MPSDPRARQVRVLFMIASVLIVLVLVTVALGAWSLLGSRAPRTQLESDLAKARAALQAKPDDPLAHEDMAYVYMRMDRQSEAIDEMEEAVRLGPENPRVHANLALLYADYEMYDEAIAAAKETIELYDRAAPAYFVLGKSYYALGDLKEARDALEKAIELEPADADARFALGEVLLDLGETDEAAEHLKIVKSQVAEYPGIDELLVKAGVEPTDSAE